MNQKEYYESLAKVYVYDPKTKENFGGPLVFLDSFLKNLKAGYIVSIYKSDSYDQHKEMFMNESDFNLFRFLLMSEKDDLRLVIKTIEKTLVEYPNIGKINHSIVSFEII